MRFSYFLVSTLFLFGTSDVHSQDSFEGNIIYEFILSGDNAEILKSYMPPKITLSIKNKDLLSKMEGGMSGTMGGFLNKGETGDVYLIKNKGTAVKLQAETEGKPNLNTVEKLEDTKEIKGYTCYKYKVVSEINGERNMSYIWASPDFVIPNLKGIEALDGPSSKYIMNEIDGFPLEILTFFDNMGMKVTMKQLITEIEETQLDEQLFKAPKKFKTKKLSELGS